MEKTTTVLKYIAVNVIMFLERTEMYKYIICVSPWRFVEIIASCDAEAYLYVGGEFPILAKERL